MKNSISICALLCTALAAAPSLAANLELQRTLDQPYLPVDHGAELGEVQQLQDNDAAIEDSFVSNSRPCPPFCVNPLNVADGVDTVAEIEVIKFMETLVYSGDGVMIDARTVSWHEKGTIPGSVNIPFTVFEKPVNDTELVAVLKRLGAKQRGDVNVIMRSLEKIGLFNGKKKTEDWDFSEAKQLLIWCNGPWCGQSPRAIQALVNLGYPSENLHYYRGGMQMWQSLGLATVLPSDLSTYASK